MGLLELKELEMVPLFRGRIGNALGRSVFRWFSVDKLNALYDRNAHITGPDFAAAVLKDLGISYQVGLAGLPVTGEACIEKVREMVGDGPFITISNHPYGSLDGVAIADLMGHIRQDYKIIVNKILARIKALESNFITVTPTGEERTDPTAASISGIRQAMLQLREGGGLGIFPSGAVSDKSLKDGCVRDREWQEPIMRLIKKANVPVLPIRFFDGNSPLYYNLGLIDWKVRLLRLPAEVFNKDGKPFRIGVGSIITPEEQKKYDDLGAFTAFLRSSVYEMALPLYDQNSLI
ncbi:MAG: 1-acyl-sn-glycerol-3-phosphate acyltransferase [Candidatus Cryptobacteroides sp.]